MKITLYSVQTCAFSAEEKAYLQSKNLPFEEKDVEKDHAALEEMLKVGNNFAGTPVTQIVKDDGTTVVLKGFTKEEFENELFPKPKEESQPAPAPQAMPAVPPTQPTPADAPLPPPPAPPQAPPAVAQQGNPLDSILQDLQSKIPPPTMGQTPPPATPPSPMQPPQMPPAPQTPVDPAQPAVPDFPKQ